MKSTDDVPEGMQSYVVPAATFATFTHRGKLDGVGNTIAGIYNEWLPSSGKTRRSDLPDIELYDERFNPTSDESEFDIRVPVS